MKALAAALLVSVAACGEGKAVFNVDVLSFLSASDSTKAYTIPIIGTVDSTISRNFRLPPGFGGSSVDSVAATVAASLENSAGSGTVILAVFFAKTQGGLFTGTPYLSDTATVAGAQTVPLGKNVVSLADTVFNTDSLWVGIRARISTTVAPMTGQLRFTDIRLRIVVQDQIL